MADDPIEWCVLNLRKFPSDLRHRLHMRAAKEQGEIYDIVARYVRVGLDHDDAIDEKSKEKIRK